MDYTIGDQLGWKHKNPPWRHLVMKGHSDDLRLVYNTFLYLYKMKDIECKNFLDALDPKNVS